MRDYLRTFSLCFEFWKNYRATEPFPEIRFQTTNERGSPDDLPRSEVKQSNPISAHYRPVRTKHKQSFQNQRSTRLTGLSRGWSTLRIDCHKRADFTQRFAHDVGN